MPDFEWKTVSVTVGPQEQWDEANRIPVVEPWWRRVLIRLASPNSYRQADFSYLMYGDDAAECEAFRGWPRSTRTASEAPPAPDYRGALPVGQELAAAAGGRTASGRPVWTRGFKDWSCFDLPTRAVYGALGKLDGLLRLIVSWSEVAKHAEALRAARWDVLILDEAHYAKSIDTKRTQAVYGIFRGASRDMGLVDSAARVWCLTGTPIPNAPNDLYPLLRAIAPDRIDDFVKYDDFLHRYCIVRKKAISRWTKIDVVVGGRNEAELKARLDGFWLRRTQKDVGINPPVYEMLPIHISDKQRKEIEAQIEGAEDILAAAETGETRGLEMALGTLRRLTGTVKAAGVADALEEELENGLDKVVLMAWHKDVMSSLEDRLKKYGVVRLDGSTTPQAREIAAQMFQTDPACRVFIGQIIAAGEAIDLSAASELVSWSRRSSQRTSSRRL